MPSTTYCFHQPLHNLMPLSHRIGRYYLCDGTSIIFHLREILSRRQQSSVNSKPVCQKSALQAIYPFPLHTYMCISPYAPREAFYISLCNIHSSDKSDTTINNGYFPMISIIYFTGESRETDL